MPDESDLRALFADSESPNRLDASRIIAKSRARRLPRQLGAAAISTLAVAGIGVLGVQTLGFPQSASDTAVTMEHAPSAGDTGFSDESALKRAPADRINLCEAPVTESSTSYSGLQLDAVFPEVAPTGTAAVVGAVRLTNTSTGTVTGTTTATAAVTLSLDGIVLWHSNGPTIQSVTVVNLAPGESLEYPASFLPVRCSVEDDLAPAFRAELPPVPAGSYELSAAIDFAPDEPASDVSEASLELVSGPPSTIVLE